LPEATKIALDLGIPSTRSRFAATGCGVAAIAFFKNKRPHATRLLSYDRAIADARGIVAG
jgi:hypothetical protein